MNNPAKMATWAIALLIIVASVIVRVRLLGVPIERDEGEYAYMAQLLLKGIPPYTSAYTMKLPGVALIYTGVMAIFGQSAAAIHIGLALTNIANVTLVYLLGRRFLTVESAFTAAAFYALLSLSQTVLGIFAHATHFVVLFSLLGISLLSQPLKKYHAAIVFLGGICLGMAVLMKQHAAIMIIFALAFQLWPQNSGNKKLFTRDCSVFLAGAVIPYAVVAFWLYHAGVFTNFWFWTVKYAGAYAASLSLAAGLNEFARQFGAIAWSNLPIWLLAVVGIVKLCRKGLASEKQFLIGYAAASLLMVSQGLYFRPHYFILLLPPIAILGGYAAQALSRLLPTGPGKLLLPLAMVMAIGCFYYFESDYLFRLTPQEVSRKIYGTNPFPEAPVIADFLKRQTTGEDRIAILGSEPEILFYADRISATGHIYMYGLMENNRYSGLMQSQLISDIEATKPAYIVVVNNSASWLLREGSLNKVLDWGDSYIPLRYDEVGIVEIFSDKPARYLWGETPAGFVPTAESFVAIFRKRL
ncbi:ArnT family glycosyltransferase [Geoanaerobacter pelophilus]|nr:glycosyltransferase family 39 protein [Geoanaerobacter pelophilus]